jgi:predicted Zn-dependent peptidase
MDKRYYVEKLENGMTTLLVPRDTKGMVYLEIEMINGRIDEQRHTLSYTHAGEHLLAMFTSSKYPDFKEINKTLGFLGVTTNAFTSDFTTGYWIKGPMEHMQLYLDLFSNMYFDYEFHDNWTKQKNIVMEEIKSRSSETWNDLYEKQNKVLYKDSRLAYGWKDNLKSMQRAHLGGVERYNKRKLNPSCTMIKVEGSFDVKEMQETLAEYFDYPQEHEVSEFVVPELPHPYRGPRHVQVRVKAAKTAKIIFHFQNNISRFDERNKSRVHSLLEYFARGYFSHLYQLLREEHGLIYGLSSQLYTSPSPKIPSYVEIEINADPKNVERVIRITLREIESLKRHLITQQDIDRVRNELKTRKSSTLLDQHLGKYVDFYGSRALWGKRPVTYGHYYTLLESVTPSDILETARRIFQPRSRLIMIGTPRRV